MEEAPAVSTSNAVHLAPTTKSAPITQGDVCETKARMKDEAPSKRSSAEAIEETEAALRQCYEPSSEDDALSYQDFDGEELDGNDKGTADPSEFGSMSMTLAIELEDHKVDDKESIPSQRPARSEDTDLKSAFPAATWKEAPWKHKTISNQIKPGTQGPTSKYLSPRRLLFPPPNHEIPLRAQESDEEPQSSNRKVPEPTWVPVHLCYDDVEAATCGRMASDLKFESRFESGNLWRAVRTSQLEYNLLLRPDLTTGGCQWYYFQVGNMKSHCKYTLNIINLYKDKSMYQQGMLPLLWSEKDAVSKGVGWQRVGSEVQYYENGTKRKNGSNYYTLSFQVEFPNDDDCCFLAMCYPYTYSDLQNDLEFLENDERRGRNLIRSSLCRTFSGYVCDLLTITNPAEKEEVDKRKAIVLTGRVHPGETNASWIMKGIIEFLTSEDPVAATLRRHFVFYVVPILNPDGVIHGYYRVSTSGQDLNRQWTDPNTQKHSTIHHTKQLIKKLAEENRLLMFCDVHGHSTKKNVFMYGCNTTAFGTSLFGCIDMHKEGFHREYAFPKLFSERCAHMSYKDCKFDMEKAKESTGRGVVFKEFDVVHSYTLEASFCGSELEGKGICHFRIDDLLHVGAEFCRTIAAYALTDNTGWNLSENAIRDLEQARKIDGPPPGASVLDQYYESLKTIQAKRSEDGEERYQTLLQAEKDKLEASQAHTVHTNQSQESRQSASVAPVEKATRCAAPRPRKSLAENTKTTEASKGQLAATATKTDTLVAQQGADVQHSTSTTDTEQFELRPETSNLSISTDHVHESAITSHDVDNSAKNTSSGPEVEEIVTEESDSGGASSPRLADPVNKEDGHATLLNTQPFDVLEPYVRKAFEARLSLMQRVATNINLEPKKYNPRNSQPLDSDQNHKHKELRKAMSLNKVPVAAVSVGQPIGNFHFMQKQVKLHPKGTSSSRASSDHVAQLTRSHSTVARQDSSPPVHLAKPDAGSVERRSQNLGSMLKLPDPEDVLPPLFGSRAIGGKSHGPDHKEGIGVSARPHSPAITMYKFMRPSSAKGRLSGAEKAAEIKAAKMGLAAGLKPAPPDLGMKIGGLSSPQPAMLQAQSIMQRAMSKPVDMGQSDAMNLASQSSKLSKVSLSFTKGSRLRRSLSQSS